MPSISRRWARIEQLCWTKFSISEIGALAAVAGTAKHLAAGSQIVSRSGVEFRPAANWRTAMTCHE